MKLGSQMRLYKVDDCINLAIGILARDEEIYHMIGESCGCWELVGVTVAVMPRTKQTAAEDEGFQPGTVFAKNAEPPRCNGNRPLADGLLKFAVCCFPEYQVLVPVLARIEQFVQFYAGESLAECSFARLIKNHQTTMTEGQLFR